MNTLILTLLLALTPSTEDVKIVLNKTETIDPRDTKTIEYPLFIEVKTESPRANVVLKMVNGGRQIYLKEVKSNKVIRLPQGFRCEYLVIFVKDKDSRNQVYRLKLSEK